MKKAGRKKDVRFGMRGRIILLVFASIVISTIIFIVNMMPKMATMLSESVSNNVYNMAIAYGTMVEEELKEKQVMTETDYTAILKDVHIIGYDSSYAYLVDRNGIMIYHPTPEKIGNKVENVVVSDLVNKLAEGIFSEPEVIEYDFKGETKIAGYYISKEDHSILVVTMDLAQVNDKLNDLYTSIALGVLLTLVICCSIGIFIASFIARPLKRLAKAADEVANLNLRENADCVKLAKHYDEAGLIARSIVKVQKDISAVITDISTASKDINNNAGELNNITIKMNENSSDNSATSEELAASMQETSATTDTIDSNVLQIDKKTIQINSLTESGINLAKEIMGRAEQLRKASVDANQKTLEMYKNVKVKTELAIEQSKSVEKIQALTDAIMNIASQTSLLSLNASIEAARAGELGRGFAVVAGEIGSLASQSTSTVSNISDIVTEVENAVASMTLCLTQTLEFLDKTVTKDYSEFIQVGEKYNNDAVLFDDSMKTINESTNSLRDSINEISIAISGINSTIAEAATGVADIAEKTSLTVSLTNDISEMVDNNATEANKLSDIVSKFQL